MCIASSDNAVRMGTGNTTSLRVLQPWLEGLFRTNIGDSPSWILSSFRNHRSQQLSGTACSPGREERNAIFHAM
jgi:hypothetical protein